MTFPLPAIQVDMDHILIETEHAGSFTVKNAGGGVLSGHILTRSHALTVSPDSWTGNLQTITYTFDPAKAIKSFETVIYICTNGGEAAIPVTVKHAAMTIPTDEGHVITSIRDFYNYAIKHPAAARRLFTTSEFYMLLLSTGYEYMEVYENLHKDVNRERAMDNFFILSGFKEKTTLTLEKQRIDIVAHPRDKTHSRFHVQKSDNGYADAPITTANAAPWINLSTERLTSSDYDHNNIATVNFTIDPHKLGGPFAREEILVGQDNALEVTVRQAAPFILRLNREGFRYEDRGSIYVENNTGYDMRLEVFCRDRYVHFYSTYYIIGTAQTIPFEIKPTALAGARRLFRRLPYVSTYIDIRAQCHGRNFQRRLHLNIGEW